RILQGAAAAMMVPQVLATIQATTTGARRTRAVGAYAATAGIAMVVGQLVGGALVSADIAGTGWRAIFFVTLPLGVAGLVLARLVLPETRSDEAARVDVAGTLLLAATLLAVLVPLTEGRALAWPAWTVALLAAAPVLAAAFVLAEVRGERDGRYPLVPPSLLRAPSMRIGLALAVPFFMGFGGFMFVFPVIMQEGEHFGAFHAGLVLAPYALSFFAVSLVVGRLLPRHGSRVIVAGLLVEAAGIVGVAGLMWAYWPEAGLLALLAPCVVAGAGQAAVMAPLFRVVLTDVPANRSGTGSGVLNTTMQTSLALGVAGLGSVFFAATPALGMRGAFVVALACELGMLLLGTVLALRLPRRLAQ
ncbi:MAG: MFS transporter, partial [Streptosporangiales bacterium]